MMIIDDCYESVVKELTSQDRIVETSNNLKLMTKNDQRVLLVYDIFEELNKFPNILKVTKNKIVSTQYRNQGNQYYKKTDYFKAWQYYNLSLMYAPLDSECYCLAISNRSIIFIHFNNYDECLKDIDLVFSMKYPENLREKLTTRQKMCKKALSNKKNDNNVEQQQVQNLSTMKGERHPIYQCASAKLEVLHTENMGRHVIAKEAIEVGEVLAIEEPYCKLLEKTQTLFSCSYCISRNLNLLPCDNCCFALYCSEECKLKAFKEYHEVECPLLATLFKMEFTKLELLALRIVIKARTDHNDWGSLFKTIDEAEKNMNTSKHGQVKVDSSWLYDSNSYQAYHSLSTNIHLRSVSDIFQKAVTAAVFLQFLMEHTNFLEPTNEEDKEKIRSCVAGTLLLNIMTCPTNMHGISSNIKNENGDYLEEVSVASAPYAFHSLLNHSCAPNVVRSTELSTGRMKLFALRPIKAGMQVFDNYGMHHAVEDRVSRLTSLEFQYKFECNCEACESNWPLYLSMRPTIYLPRHLKVLKDKILSVSEIRRLQKGCLKSALKLFKPLCQLCTDLEVYAPSAELCDCQEAIKQCLVIFQGLVPYGHTQTVTWVICT